MHCHCDALLLRYDELEDEVKVKHIPQLDNPILSTTCNHVILVELHELVCFFLHLELARRNILIVEAPNLVDRRMA